QHVREFYVGIAGFGLCRVGQKVIMKSSYVFFVGSGPRHDLHVFHHIIVVARVKESCAEYREACGRTTEYTLDARLVGIERAGGVGYVEIVNGPVAGDDVDSSS